jgi:hypothetical protein
MIPKDAAVTTTVTREDPFSPDFEDPFGRDPYAGMTAEERKDLENELALDPDAEKNDEEDGEDEGDEEDNNGDGKGSDAGEEDTF